MRALFRSGCVAAIMVLTSCAPTSIPLTVDDQKRLYPVVQTLIDSSMNVRSYRLLLSGRDNNGRPYRLAVAYLAPAHMRVDVLPIQGGYALAVLVVNGREFTSLDMESKTGRRGPVSKAVLLDLLGLEIEPLDLASILVAQLPPSLRALQGEITGKRARADAVEFGTRLNRSRFTVDAKTGTILEIVLGTESSDEIVVSYPIPDELHVRLPVQQREQQFLVSRRVINPELSRELFNVTIPAGFRVTAERIVE